MCVATSHFQDNLIYSVSHCVILVHSPQVFDLEGTMFGASGDYLDAFSMDLLDEAANLSDGKPARAHLLSPLWWCEEAG